MSSESLRSVLGRTDMTAPAIQASAGGMMRLYDKSVTTAVTEWRNSLQTCRVDQLVPLLYVANEVLQTSKRNRGSLFLEAFGPTLGSSLKFICERDPKNVEKVRRTVKIWGDRRVFSLRFVGELLQGLDKHRPGHATTTVNPPPARSSSVTKKRMPSPSIKRTPALDEGEDEHESSFLGDTTSSLLNVDFKIDHMALSAAVAAATAPSSSKRRRISATSAGNDATTASSDAMSSSPQKSKFKSTQGLVDTLQSATRLDEQFRSSMGILAAIASRDQVDDSVVGDELVDLYRSTNSAISTCSRQRIKLHSIADELHTLEQEAVGYIPWLRGGLEQDEADIVFAKTLLDQLTAIKQVQGHARAEREKRLELEARQKALAEEEERKLTDERERREMLESAMKEPEAKPGMIWNPVAREYQYIDTNESWRD